MWHEVEKARYELKGAETMKFFVPTSEPGALLPRGAGRGGRHTSGGSTGWRGLPPAAG
jgi:hypothetical protein